MEFISFQSLKTILIIILMFTLPGWAMLSIFNYWKRWETLQRWVIAICLSISFYPVLFYLTRYLRPEFQIGPNKLILIGFISLLVIGINLRRHMVAQFRFEKLEIIAILVIMLTIVTRLIVLSSHPYPAWTDSLHHTLITELTAQSGRLPFTLQPYENVRLDMYHLGLYALTGSLEMLAQIPAYTALQWMSEILSGLCVIGIFLFLDRYFSRKSAIIGLIICGLFSFQPNWYFNWGRFTQLSAQIILVTGFVLNLEVIHDFENLKPKMSILSLLLAGLLNAGIFLLHFRVAIFYAMALMIICFYKLFLVLKQKEFIVPYLKNLFLLIVISLILILPVVIPAMKIYFLRSKGMQIELSGGSVDLSAYITPLATIFDIGIRKWLLLFSLPFIGISLFKKNKYSIGILIWVILLYILGYMYVLGNAALIVTNIGAILIMLYIPLALLIGIGFFEFTKIIPDRFAKWIFIAFIISALPFSFLRTKDVDDGRFFIETDDLSAMSWINENLPKDAIIGIKPFFWLDNYPHGIDAGMWIPYFANRKTNIGTMLFNLSSMEDRQIVVNSSEFTESIFKDFSPDKISEICHLKIGYLYDKNNSIIHLDSYAKNDLLAIIYENKKIKLIQINCN